MSTSDRVPDTQRTRRTYVYHVRDLTRAWWFVTDGVRAVTVHHPDATETEAREKWANLLGDPPGGFTRIPGFVRPEVAAEEIAAEQIPARPGIGGGP